MILYYSVMKKAGYFLNFTMSCNWCLVNVHSKCPLQYHNIYLEGSLIYL